MVSMIKTDSYEFTWLVQVGPKKSGDLFKNHHFICPARYPACNYLTSYAAEFFGVNDDDLSAVNFNQLFILKIA